MAEKVENKDLFADDVFKKTVADVELLIKELDKLEAKFIEIAKIQKNTLKNSDTSTIEGIRKTNESVKTLSDTEKAFNKVQADKLRLRQQLKIANSAQADELAQLRILTQEQTKNVNALARKELEERGVIEKSAAERKKLNKELEISSNAFKKLTRDTDIAKAEFKRLAAEFGVNSVQAKKARAEFERLDKKLVAVNSAARDGQRFVGNYGNAFNKLGGILKSGLGILGITAGIAGIARLVGNAVNIFKDFEQANSKLQSVLGATADEMKQLSNLAKDLGASTSFTASQVTELQTEFAKLGFPTKDILNMTESTLNAAAAMGSGLGEQAALTGATIKAFGLTSQDTARVNDVLAKSTTRSALDFSKLNASMSTIAPVAKALGFGLEDTVALLGNLSDSGFDASTAATATRNIMLNLADSSSVLSKRLKEPVKDLPSLIKGLKQLTNEGVDLSEALELTDVRSVAAFSTFLEGTDSLERLSAELNNANGASKQMADTMLDNLAGDITKAESAWEGFILSLEDGEGAISKALRSITQFVTEALSGLTRLNQTAQEIAESNVKKLNNEFVKAGKENANEIKRQLKSVGLAGKELDNALIRAFKQAKEFGKAAKERGDVGLAATYFAEAAALKDMLTPQKENTEGTIKDTKATKENTKATNDKTDALKKQRDEYIKLQKEINDITVGKLKEQEVDDSSILKMKKRLDEEAHAREMERQRQLDNEKKLIEQRKELTEAALEVLGSMLEEYHKKELEGIDRQLDATEKRVDQLRKRAELGQLASQESLAFEQKKLAELELERARQQKKQQREQALFTVISTYQQKLSDNDKTPLLSTIKDITVLKSFASTLAGFYEGTDEVAKSLGKPQLSGKDGHIIRVDGKEQIWSGKDRAEVGFRSREEIKDLIGLVDSGFLNNITDRDAFNPNSFVLNGLLNKKVLNKLNGIEKAIKNIDIPEGMVKIDEVRGLINLYSRKANKQIVERSKLFK